MLELSSLRDVEPALRAEGFFDGGADGVVADVYLGTACPRRSVERLGQFRPSLARCRWQCCGCGPRASVPAGRHVTRSEPGSPTWSRTDYAAAIGAVREAIAAGDVYQVNLVQHLAAPFSRHPAGLAGALAPLRPLAPAAVRGRRLGDRLRLARALPRAPRPAGPDDADQGDAARTPGEGSPRPRRTPPST